MQKLSAGVLRKLTSHPGKILIGLSLVMLIVLGACSPTTITETITITPPPETVTITPTLTSTPTSTSTPPPPYVGLKNPFSWDDTSAHEAGSMIFGESCAVCHVPAAEGVPALGIDFNTIDYRQNLEERPDFYFWTVSEGRLDTIMPPWLDTRSEEERWQVLTYIWSLGEAVSTTPPPSPAPPVVLGDLASGQAIFETTCMMCHTIGGGTLVGPDLEGVMERREVSWLKVQIQSPSVHRGQNDPISMANLEEFGLPMPDLGLTEQQVEGVLAYLQTAETGPTAVPAQYAPTLVIGLLAMLGITLIGLRAGTKKVEVRP